MDKPRIIHLPEIQGKQGKYSVIEQPLLPFEIKRVYYIHDSVSGVSGGNHAHQNADRILVCLKGRADVQLESQEGIRHTFILDHPTKALYFPRLHWITYTLTNDAILLALVNTPFASDVKITEYANFKHQKY